MTKYKILKKARRVLSTRWTSGKFVYLDGSVCALGGIAVASGWNPQSPKRGYVHLRENGQRDATIALASVISGYEITDYDSAEAIVINFNDSPHSEINQQKQKVLAAFDKAIKQTAPWWRRWLP